MIRSTRLGAILAAGLILLVIGSSAVRADQWDLRMLDGGVTPVPSTLSHDFGTWTSGTVPGGMSMNFYALLRNLSTTQDLYVGGYYDGFSGASPALDGRTWWTSQGENHIGDTVAAGDSLTAWLGTFDASAFLWSLPADGNQYSALIDFTYLAVDGNLDPFDPDLPDGITPGPPSLRLYGRINPSGPSNVVPEASTMTLLGTMGLWAAPLGIWRLRRARKQDLA
jgi:hypothetical protein